MHICRRMHAYMHACGVHDEGMRDRRTGAVFDAFLCTHAGVHDAGMRAWRTGAVRLKCCRRSASPPVMHADYDACIYAYACMHICMHACVHDEGMRDRRTGAVFDALVCTHVGFHDAGMRDWQTGRLAQSA